MLGKRLTTLRNERGLTQEQLAKIFNMSRSTYAQYEVDRRKPDYDTLKLFADYFGISTDYLLGQTSIRELDIVDIFQNDDVKVTASGKPLTQEQRIGILRALDKPILLKLRLPIIGEIKAGIPLLSEQNIIGYIYIPADLEGKADFALYVHGDSMIGAGIQDNDVVVCKQQETASNGQIIAALINQSETTLKYFIQENGKSLLRAANPAYKDIHLGPEDKVQGYVVKIMKDPPPINRYREFIYLKEGHLQEWNEVIEKAAGYGIKPDKIKNILEMHWEMLNRK